MEPKIDIIIPAYNAKQTIGRLIDSLKRQNNQDFRIIIVDDGSCDGTYEYCLDISKETKMDIKVLKQENQGPAIARQTALKKSSANYVMFCDADDYLHESTISIILENLTDRDLDILEFGFQKVDDRGNSIKSTNLVDEFVSDSCLQHYIKQKNTTNYLCNKVIKREKIQETDFKQLYYSEDFRALVYIFSRCSRYKIIHDKLYYYVISDLSACGRRFDIKRLDVLRVDQEIGEMIGDRYQELIPYQACNCCIHVTKLYIGFFKDDFLNDELKRYLRDIFKKNYKILTSKKRTIYRKKSLRQILAIELYNLSPQLFTLFANIK